MSYRLYQTEAFILGAKPSGEANRTLELLTPELGLVLATAQGSRKIKSKLRYHLTSGSLARVSLIRGREYWRLISAEKFIVPSVQFMSLSLARARARVFNLISRLVHGEGNLEKVFFDLKSSQTLLYQETLSENELNNYSLLAGARMLFFLGYLAPPEPLSPYLSFADWQRSSLSFTDEVKQDIVRLVSEALVESQL